MDAAVKFFYRPHAQLHGIVIQVISLPGPDGPATWRNKEAKNEPGA
jgi:hypothetical protein